LHQSNDRYVKKFGEKRKRKPRKKTKKIAHDAVTVSPCSLTLRTFRWALTGMK